MARTDCSLEVTTLLREHFDPEELKAMTPAQKEAASAWARMVGPLGGMRLYSICLRGIGVHTVLRQLSTPD